MNILITGGTGYIGSHTVIEFLAAGHDVVIVDNLYNSSRDVLTRIEKISGKNVPFYEADLRNTAALDEIFSKNSFDAVIHFAGLKAVGESVADPLLYFDGNVGSTISLLKVMKSKNVNRLVFSSSATVYGSAPVPYIESYPAGRDIASPYGRTKYMVEEILSDYANSNSSLELTSLRYFNPIGAHPSGLIGENPNGIPNNLMPYIAQVAVGKREKLSIFGDDYDTIDGTGVRDYIHVVDVARGHVAALTHSKPGNHVYNLGSGKGTSVLELVHAFEAASGQKIAYEIAPRRAGDLPEYYANVDLAAKELEWQTELSVEDACRDTWNWQSKNPNGYAD
jgi:UDP-glucose 4-epimerase